MHSIEPFYLWREIYIASDDKLSPFYKREYSEFEFTNSIYNYLIHPQWDEIGSSTLFVKILFTDYETGFSIIELFGEWNDCLHEDIMYLKRNVIDILFEKNVNKFLLICENVLNFHSSDDEYYQEWFDELENGWICGINLRQHVVDEFVSAKLDYYIGFSKAFNELNWRNYTPEHLYEKVNSFMTKYLNT